MYTNRVALYFYDFIFEKGLEEAWKNWEKSSEHIADHKAKIKEHGGKPPKPEYVLSMEHANYTVLE
ncbi:hypothetical protein [Psychrobacillus soli]|uniref:hypothetical protein n=1 Tax=Psychrobacillus soli TaxID=1543965 RepID=UPI003CCC8733